MIQHENQEEGELKWLWRWWTRLLMADRLPVSQPAADPLGISPHCIPLGWPPKTGNVKWETLHLKMDWTNWAGVLAKVMSTRSETRRQPPSEQQQATANRSRDFNGDVCRDREPWTQWKAYQPKVDKDGLHDGVRWDGGTVGGRGCDLVCECEPVNSQFSPSAVSSRPAWIPRMFAAGLQA